MPLKDKLPKPEKFPFTSKRNIKVQEPSDVAYNKDSKTLYIVSDNGNLYECDTLGNILREAPSEGWDYEAVEVRDSSVYVSDESARKIIRHSKKDLSIKNVYHVRWHAGRNEGVESLTYNETKKCFVMIAEKGPTTIIEVNADFVSVYEQRFSYARDISSARWYNGYMYLLSDEDHCIFQCDPITYKPIRIFNIDVLNPEGICFDGNGNVIISADDLQRLYYFNKIPS